MFESRDKLVKILRMFSSFHDGEVAAAARLAHKIVKDLALDWDDLLVKSIEPSGPEPEDDDDDEAPLAARDRIDWCLEQATRLTAWEREFLGSIRLSLLDWGQLTPKQRAVLDRIVRKLQLQDVW